MKKSKILLTLCLAVLSLPSAGAYAQDDVNLNPLNPSAGQVSVYQISFIVADTLYPDGQIHLTFPQSFDLSDVKLANSTSINGGFNVSTNENRVTLNRTGLGRTLVPGEAAEVKFANVVNPQDSTQEYSVRIEFQDSADEAIQRTEELTVVLRAPSSK